MPSASLSAAASAAVSTSSTALGVAVTSACRPPSVGSWSLLASHSGVSFRLGIKLALGDVLHDPVGYQVPDRLARLDPGAALGGRDGQRRDLHQADLPVGQARPRQPVPRTGTAYEMREGEKLVHVVPGQDLGQRVGAGDEEQLVV